MSNSNLQESYFEMYKEGDQLDEAWKQSQVPKSVIANQARLNKEKEANRIGSKAFSDRGGHAALKAGGGQAALRSGSSVSDVLHAGRRAMDTKANQDFANKLNRPAAAAPEKKPMDDFAAGGGEAKMKKTGMTRDQVIAQGKKNLANSYEPDTFDTILEYLISEGYAETNENAIVIMSNMSEEWRNEILDEARAEEKRGYGSTGAQRQRQKSGEEGPRGRRPATSYSGGQNPHLRGKGGGNKTQRRESSRRYVDQPGGIYAKPENKQGEGRYASMQAKKRDQSHMSSRFD